MGRCRLQPEPKLTINHAASRVGTSRDDRRSDLFLRIQGRSEMNRRITTAGAAVALAMRISGVGAQETGTATGSAKPNSGNLTSNSDAMPQTAARDPKNWIHPNGNYSNTRYYP